MDDHTITTQLKLLNNKKQIKKDKDLYNNT